MKSTLHLSKNNTFTLRTALILMAGLLAAHLAPAAVTNTWSGTGPDLKWSDAVNWSGVTLATGNDVQFLQTGTNNASPGPNGISNSVVDMTMTVGALVYDHTNCYHTTYIGPNVTLTVSNTTTPVVMVGSATADEGSTAQNYTTIFGGGALIVTNNQVFNVRQGSTTAGTHHATLALSGLSTLNAYVSLLEVAGDGAAGASLNRGSGTLMLAQTNLIVSTGSPGLKMADSQSGACVNNFLYLGQTNAIFVNNEVMVGGRKGTAWLGFNTNAGVTLVNPTVLFRNVAGTGPQSIWGIADRSTDVGSTTGSGTCTMDFTGAGGYVDAQVSTIYVGRGQNYTSASAAGRGTGALIYTNGTITAGVVEVGYAFTTGGPATGTLNIGGAGQLTVSGGSPSYLRLGNTISGAPSLSTGVLNIGLPSPGGSVWINGPVVEGGGTGDAISVNGGSLKVSGMLGNTNSTPASVGPLESMTLSSATLTFDLGSTPNPASPWWQVGALTVTPPVTNNVQGIALAVGKFTLLQYASLSGDDGSAFTQSWNTLPPRVSGYFSNDTVNSSIDLVITSVSSPKWNGNVAGGAWDINTTANWRPITGSGAITYLQLSVPGDAVLFDDSATGTTTVNLTTTLSPAAISLNNSGKNYTFTGSGALSGSTGLTKGGTGSLTITNTGTNTFTGAVTINQGAVILSGAANRLPTNAAVTLANDPTALLTLNNTNQMLGSLAGGGASGGNVNLGTNTLTLSGGGGSYSGTISGGGMVVQNGGVNVFMGANSYTGGTIVSNGTLVVANTAGSGVGSGNLTVQPGGYFQIGDDGADGIITVGTITNNGYVELNRSDDFTLATLLTGTGGLIKGVSSDNYDTVTITNANNYSGLTTIAYGTLCAAASGALGTGMLTIGGDASAVLALSNSITLNQPVTVQMKGNGSTKVALDNVAGTNILAGPITLMGGGTYWNIQSDAGDLICQGPSSISSTLVGGGNRHLRLVANGGNGEWYGNINSLSGETTAVGVSSGTGGTGTWTLWGTNGYTGTTSISGGQLNVNGAITASTSVTVGTGATLSGTGAIASSVAIQGGGILCGYSVTSSGNPSGAPAGRLTLNNSLSLDPGSTTILGVSHAGCDQIGGLPQINMAGSLQVVQTGPLLGGETFKLFDAASYTGDFYEPYALPDLTGLPLSWDPSSVPTTGILRLSGTLVPIVQSATSSGPGNFQLSGIGPTNWNYSVVATTNITQPLSNWVQVASGTFVSGTFTFSDPHAGLYPRRFYQVVTQSP